jgi:hypothetical protein
LIRCVEALDAIDVALMKPREGHGGK